MMPATMDASMPNVPGSGSADYPAPRRAADGPALPYAKAFVVQFTAQTDAQLEHATGRVEHLLSGRRARFASTADLLACIVALLADDRSALMEQGEPPARGSRGPKSAPAAPPSSTGAPAPRSGRHRPDSIDGKLDKSTG